MVLTEHRSFMSYSQITVNVLVVIAICTVFPTWDHYLGQFFLLPFCVWVGRKEIGVSVHLISARYFGLNLKIHLVAGIRVFAGVICPSLWTQTNFWLLFHGRVKQKLEICLCSQATFVQAMEFIMCCLAHCRVQIPAIHCCYHPSMVNNTSVFCHSWRI